MQKTATLAALAGAGLLVLTVLIVGLLAFAPSPTSSIPVGTFSAVPMGEVSGLASPCVGFATLAAVEADPVRVTLSRGSQVVTSETVTGDHRFLLAAPPGRYVITSDQYQRPTRFAVVIHGLETAHLNLPVACK